MHAERLTRWAIIFAFLTVTAAAMAAEPARPPGQSELKNLIGEMWARLRAVGARSQPAQSTQTVTAGIRGAEATESELKPYWKGDRDQDPAYRAERQELQAAQDLADAGKFAEAAKAFDAFSETHPRSPLTSEARFGGALAQAALGDKPRAIAGFE
ncbi:MAG TPA: tetratricopeptide repeat protein, partial [Burkholderiales bacterium]